MTKHIIMIAILVLLPACSDSPENSDSDADTGSDTDPGNDADVRHDTDISDDADDQQDADSRPDSDDPTDSDTDPDQDIGPVTNLCVDTSGFSNPASGSVGHTEIAHWKGDRAATLSITFDDSTPGQAIFAVPDLIDHGLTGTFFVNPGNQPYLDNKEEVWESMAVENFQELANHTMNHEGAATLDDARYQIGEAARIITEAYPDDRSPLIGFNRGGGTPWGISEEQIQDLLVEFNCIERSHSTGVYAATPPDMMADYLHGRLSGTGDRYADDWGIIHFHGICDPTDTVNCRCEEMYDNDTCREFWHGINNGAVSANQFTEFLDLLTTESFFVNDVWIAGFIAAHKYQQERNNSQVVMAENDDDHITLCLTTSMDTTLYDEALTLMTEVPDSWTNCRMNQDGVLGDCHITDGIAYIDARPNNGDITIEAL